MTPHDLRLHLPAVELPAGYDLPRPVVPEFARLYLVHAGWCGAWWAK